MDVPPNPAPNPGSEYRSELARTVISNSAPSVALENRAHATPDTSIDWTNEKHRSYINSLEASFVNKLYQSRRLQDSYPQIYVKGTNPSHEFPFKTYNSSDQFNVVQDSHSQKLISPNNGTLIESTADSNSTLVRLRMEHILSRHKDTQLRRNATSEHLGVIAKTSEQNPACHQDSVDSTEEVSGQNFVDEDHIRKPSCEFMPKRLKRASTDASSNDQLVPLGNLDTEVVSVACHAPSGREEQGQHQLLLEHPNSWVATQYWSLTGRY
ncbi:cold-regulated protein 28 [Argentina anserina]|uniref:cold-regulated protein 28 n=1 Tax=Argentina anserina TaxID=57926 RepID=UPI0021764FBA|nr:cold-regulated protein 28 [Potentilla anserina]